LQILCVLPENKLITLLAVLHFELCDFHTVGRERERKMLEIYNSSDQTIQ